MGARRRPGGERLARRGARIVRDMAALDEARRQTDAEARARASTAEFHAMQVTQRPTFIIESEIGDRAIFSGIATLPPLVPTST